MRASRWLSLALGLALAAPVAAYAYDTPVLHNHVRHGAVEHRAAPMAPAVTYLPEARLGRPSYTTSHRQLEIEGLTRNPDDCAKYGCIGNN